MEGRGAARLGSWARLGILARRGFGQVTPEPFVIAVLLSALVGVASAIALSLGTDPPTDGIGPALLGRWQGSAGLWGLLAFTTQAGLMLVLGTALASAPAVRRGLERLVTVPSGARGLVALTAAVSCVLCVVNWSLGLVCGAVFARAAGREAARRGLQLHYPLLCAAGYAGMMAWHGGLSGTAPLKATTSKDMVEVLGAELAARVGVIPLSESLRGDLNLWVTGGLLVLAPLLFAAMTPAEGADPEATAAPADGESGLDRRGGGAARVSATSDREPPADAPKIGEARGAAASDDRLARLERSPVITWLLALPMLGALGLFLARGGIQALDLNTVNLGLWAAALILHGRPDRFVAACEDGIRGCAGIFLLFPLYAGIMGMMGVSGLSARLAQLFADVGDGLFTTITFGAAGLLNLFVPSGGGQWAIQGPILMDAALARGIAPADAMMAMAYGDQWTNMLQPFWAVPLLAITGVRARDIVGYCAIWMVVGGLWIVGGLLLWT
ncbi:MAG: TIGR00366 family protein [Nannocystaceae bacterium]